jgi:hypothetical protein
MEVLTLSAGTETGFQNSPYAFSWDVLFNVRPLRGILRHPNRIEVTLAISTIVFLSLDLFSQRNSFESISFR